MIVADFSDGWFGGVIMMWVNLNRARDELPYSMSNWKNRQLLQCHLRLYPSQILFYRLWKNCRSQPFVLAYLSSPLKKVRFPSTAPQQLVQRPLKKAYVCTAPNAFSMRGCWRIFIYYRADITHLFITKRPPRFFFPYWKRVHGDWVTSLPTRFGHPNYAVWEN